MGEYLLPIRQVAAIIGMKRAAEVPVVGDLYARGCLADSSGSLRLNGTLCAQTFQVFRDLEGLRAKMEESNSNGSSSAGLVDYFGLQLSHYPKYAKMDVHCHLVQAVPLGLRLPSTSRTYVICNVR